MNTSLGNITLMTTMVWSYCQLKSITCALINDGDDCVVIMESGDLTKFLDGIVWWFDESGFILKVETPVYIIEHIEFCQSHPIEITPGVYRMVRDPRMVLDKDLVVVKPIQHESDYNFFRRAIGMCGMALAGDVPIFCQFYQTLIRGTTETKRKVELESGMQYLALRMSPRFKEPTTTARVSFWEAFRISPDMQIALEQDYSRMTLQWNTPSRMLRFSSHIAGLR